MVARTVTDPMLVAVEGHRAWLAAYSVAPFEDGQEEAVWVERNPNPAGDTLHSEPPLPTTTAGALAAVRFVMEDEGFVQTAHATILSQALAFLEGPADPKTDPFAAAMTRFNAEVAAYNTSGDDFENDRDGKTYDAISDRLFSEPDGSPPSIASAVGALLALDRIIELETPFCDGESEALARHLRAYLSREAGQ